MEGSLDRRSFLTWLGKGSLAVAVFGLAACADDEGATTTTTTGGTTSSAPPATTPPTSSTVPSTAAPAETGTTAAPATTEATVPADPGRWTRVDLGFVSAYILVRDGEAAVVDTGVAGSGARIESILTELGLGWEVVRHVIITHLHRDHQGSLGEVMANAPEALGYAGAADLPGIASPRPLTAVGDGDEVFGLRVISTPGHTAGHIAVLDPATSVIAAGDAITGADAMGGQAGEVAGPNPDFTPDMATAIESVRKMAALEFDTIFFGHGTPVQDGGSEALAALAATL